jgi:hypothetical protein
VDFNRLTNHDHPHRPGHVTFSFRAWRVATSAGTRSKCRDLASLLGSSPLLPLSAPRRRKSSACCADSCLADWGCLSRVR